MLSRKRLAAQQIRAFLLGKPTLASLGWDDFAHLRELRDLAARMVSHRGEGVPNGANILIYGKPGTGKSEFVKTLATRLGSPRISSANTTAKTPSPTGKNKSRR